MPIQRIERPLDGRRRAGPFRPVDWRAQEAVAVVAEGLAPSPRLYDRETVTLAHYFRRRRACRTVQDRSPLARRMPIAHKAVQFQEEASDSARCIAQSLALANQPAQHIGPQVGLSPEAMDFFEKCFFDVRGRPSAFIMDQVIRLPAAGPIDEPFAAAVVRFLAWRTGPSAVELLLPFRGDQWTSLADLAATLARRARILMDVHTLCHQWQAAPARQAQVRAALESIEASPEPYGDESVPRTEAQLLKAKQTLLDQILLDRLHGIFPNQESEHVH